MSALAQDPLVRRSTAWTVVSLAVGVMSIWVAAVTSTKFAWFCFGVSLSSMGFTCLSWSMIIRTAIDRLASEHRSAMLDEQINGVARAIATVLDRELSHLGSDLEAVLEPGERMVIRRRRRDRDQTRH